MVAIDGTMELRSQAYKEMWVALRGFHLLLILIRGFVSSPIKKPSRPLPAKAPVIRRDQLMYVAGTSSLKSTGMSSSLGGGCVPVTPPDATISPASCISPMFSPHSRSILTTPHPSSQYRLSLLF